MDLCCAVKDMQRHDDTTRNALPVYAGEVLNSQRQAGMTLLEVIVAFAIIGVVSALAVPAMDDLFSNQRAKGAARDVADALMMGRAEAVRTGNTHLVVFQGALSASAPIVVVDDGAPSSANCTIEGGETRHTWEAVQDVSWGTSTHLANGAAAPDDPGGSPSTVSTGSSFTNAASTPAAATWVLFQPDGIPRLFTPSGSACTNIGLPAQGGGAIYVTNTERDYAIVMSHLGTVRVHPWDPIGGAWMQ
jgi:prepilin-type N-terminal cleavage/methylation domain-containing protein